MINIKNCLLLLLSLLIITACEEEGQHEPLEKNTTPPGVVSEVQVDNLPGRAMITYSLPADQDLLYVKAVYTLATGQAMEVRASYYKNSLVVEGFADTLEHEIKLYAVNRSEVASDPITIKIKPLEAPVWRVYKTLEAQPAFGGIRIKAINKDRSDVAILVMEKNDLGEWEANTNSIYTSTDSIMHTIRGYDTLTHQFAVTVRDRWLNYTDTLVTEIKPLYEAAIPKSGYAPMNLPGDAPHHPSTEMTGLWDNNIIDWPGIYMTQGAHTPNEPHVITFDIGTLAKLSRIVIWDYPEYYNGRTYYYLGCPKIFEIWGSDNPPSDGSFDNWHLLGQYEEVKPSGLPYGEQNDEDYQTANAGFSWEFDVDVPKVRYLRIRGIKNWGGTTNLAIAEVQVYGDVR